MFGNPPIALFLPLEAERAGGGDPEPPGVSLTAVVVLLGGGGEREGEGSEVLVAKVVVEVGALLQSREP